ncbi:MAG: type IV secretion system DNA-binding domain-containing protein [Pseudomonadota bacterium]|nr:type IV secretion system DNA-binding domain-containing protein [Pseudomonadota bacterium]
MPSNPINTISKGLFESIVFFKDIRTQTLLLISVFLVVFIAWLGDYFFNLDTIHQQNTITSLKIYFYDWLGMSNKELSWYNDQSLITTHSVQSLLSLKAFTGFTALHQELLLSKIYQPLLTALSVWFFLTWVIYKFGRKINKHEIMEGVTLCQPAQYNKQLNRNQSDLKIGNVPWYKHAEVQHLLVTGDPGTGKSLFFSQLLRQIRRRGEIVICYDIKGDFIRNFYNPDFDQILSPFDARSVIWDPWLDLENDLHFETFAEAIIKENKQDAFWSRAAKMVLVTALKKGKAQQWSFNQTIQFITTKNLDTLEKWFDNTEVSSDFSNEKTAASILSELKTQIRSLNYLPSTDNKLKTFSLKTWLGDNLNTLHTDSKNQKKPAGWLFLPVQEQYKAVATPIIAAQLELLANHILSLPTNRNRRIWFIVDELPSIPKLTILSRLLAQGRGYGVAAVLAIQNLSQLKEAYGNYGANALTGLCSSLLSLRASDPETASFVSKRMGKHIRKEQQNSQSHSKNKNSKGVSEGQSEHIIERPAVSETLIMTLDDLNGVFLCKGVSNPVAVQIQIQNMESINEGFIEAEDLTDRAKPQKPTMLDKPEYTAESFDIKPKSSKWEV